MGRFLKIGVYVAVLFLAYLWIATVAQSCNKKATADSNDNTEMVDDMVNVETDEFEDDLFEDEEEGSDFDETATTNGMGGGNEVENYTDTDAIDYTEVDEIINKSTPPRATSKSTESNTNKPNIRNVNTSYSGKYLLLAGSYLIEDNAQTMVKKLKKLGYSDSEIVIFNMSQYHSVCAARYTSLSSAQQESSTLKRKGIDNYVHTKQ